MTLPRRRFLKIAAATLGAAALPRAAAATGWQGTAFGAEAAITLRGGDPGRAQAAIAAALAELRGAEAAFSLHDPASELARLNADGSLTPSPRFAALMADCDRAVALTGGLFDPAVQTLWPGAGGAGQPLPWSRIDRSRPDRIALAPGQKLTFNGIAQGHASDRVSAALRAFGYDRTLVDMGEIRAEGGPWRIGLSDPAAGLYGSRTLTSGALATSSPGLLMLGPTRSHILDPFDPDRAPLWSSVTVEADSATLADALSTAACHMDRAALAGLLDRTPDLRAVTLVDADGTVATLRRG